MKLIREIKVNHPHWLFEVNKNSEDTLHEFSNGNFEDKYVERRICGLGTGHIWLAELEKEDETIQLENIGETSKKDSNERKDRIQDPGCRKDPAVVGVGGQKSGKHFPTRKINGMKRENYILDQCDSDNMNRICIVTEVNDHHNGDLQSCSSGDVFNKVPVITNSSNSNTNNIEIMCGTEIINSNMNINSIGNECNCEPNHTTASNKWSSYTTSPSDKWISSAKTTSITVNNINMLTQGNTTNQNPINTSIINPFVEIHNPLLDPPKRINTNPSSNTNTTNASNKSRAITKIIPNIKHIGNSSMVIKTDVFNTTNVNILNPRHPNMLANATANISGSCYPWLHRAWPVWFLLLLVFSGAAGGGLPGPSFVGTIANNTVTIGRDAVLSCQVQNLRGYKVAWVQVETQTILTIHNTVITRNPRVGLSHEDQSIYRLHLKDVVESDRGFYMCQINTDPMINQMGYLQIVVPPDFEESSWPGDLVVREGINVSLECRARGYPPPTVTWRKEDPSDNNNYVVVGEGEVLHMVKVSRLDMGAYLCVASNGIQPSVSKRTQLKVQFPPMLWIPNQLEGARLGGQITLECNTEAYPRSINYWTNHRGEMIADAVPKYDTVTREDSYKTYMRLTIHNLTADDFTTYRCIAKNSLGETDGSIKLYEMYPSQSSKGSPATNLPSSEDYPSTEDGASEDSSLDSEDSMGEGEGEGDSGTGPRSPPSSEGQRGARPVDPYRQKQRARGRSDSPSWRNTEALNELYSEVDVIFREKEGSFIKGSGIGANPASPYDLTFSFDSGALGMTTPFSLLAFVAFCLVQHANLAFLR